MICLELYPLNADSAVAFTATICILFCWIIPCIRSRRLFTPCTLRISTPSHRFDRSTHSAG
jgi:hypothetical protein